ncbi:hypothetical protein ACWIUD_00395 [Helicobacter sp. 23-1044]
MSLRGVTKQSKNQVRSLTPSLRGSFSEAKTTKQSKSNRRCEAQKCESSAKIPSLRGA